MCHAQLGPGGLMLVPFDRARLYVLFALIRSVVRDSPRAFFREVDELQCADGGPKLRRFRLNGASPVGERLAGGSI
jgi:hypothetical protein